MQRDTDSNRRTSGNSNPGSSRPRLLWACGGMSLAALAIVVIWSVFRTTGDGTAEEAAQVALDRPIEKLEPLRKSPAASLEPDLVPPEVVIEEEVEMLTEEAPAELSVELSDVGVASSPLNSISSTNGKSLAGRSAGARRQVVRAYGGSAAAAPRLAPPDPDTVLEQPDVDGGEGPGQSGNNFDKITENPFRRVGDQPLSTFSIDVDTASYSLVRNYLQNYGKYPPADSVRIEEFVNYFQYDYAPPKGEDPFAAHVEVADCPWQQGHRLLRVALKGKEIKNEDRPASNLVFLVDVSGSMSQSNKLPLVKQSLKLLLDVLRPQDRVALVVYASGTGVVLPSTSAERKSEIATALDKLQAGGSTAGAAGIELAYKAARENFLPQGTNRVILCTDGDFNVGLTSRGGLERFIEEQAKSGVFLSIMGFGMGNYQDGQMEALSGKGNGNYGYIDNLSEARKVFVAQLTGTLVTIAKDVKIQIEFNPAVVGAYRLIGYENRLLAAQDFNDDKKDAGEIGAGHTVTALYELVPPDQLDTLQAPGVDKLKYQAVKQSGEAAGGELLTLKLRYKQPDGAASKLLTIPVKNRTQPFGQASGDFQFASAVAAFGMLLRHSEHAGNATFGFVKETATAAQGKDPYGYRAQFVELVTVARGLVGQP